MVDWERFRSAYMQPDPRVAILAELGRLETWLDSLVAGFEAAAADVETARMAEQAAVVLRQKLVREGPLTPGETLGAQYEALGEAVVAGRASLRERGFFFRYDHLLGLSRVLQAMYPQIVVAPAETATTIGERLQVLFPRLQAAQRSDVWMAGGRSCFAQWRRPAPKIGRPAPKIVCLPGTIGPKDGPSSKGCAAGEPAGPGPDNG